jgi:glutaredoxin
MKKSIKIFVSNFCGKCAEAKLLHEKLLEKGIDSQLYNVETMDGLAEASFYGVDQIPSVLWEDENGDTVGCRGSVPDINKLIQ